LIIIKGGLLLGWDDRTAPEPVINPNEERRPEMKLYCGIDLHAKQSCLCIIGEKDKVHLREKVANDLEAIVSMPGAFCPRPAVAVEATLNWYWLIDGLQESGFDVKLAHTLGLLYMITGDKGRKADRRDAFSLAKLLGLDAIPSLLQEIGSPGW
jgi:transposase